MPRVAFATIGCKVNQYETQLMRERLERAGFEVVPFSSLADVYIVNTCSVTEEADKKSMQAVKKALLKNKLAKIYVTGCFVEADSRKIKNKYPEVKIVRNIDKLRIEKILLPEVQLNGDFTIHSFFSHDRAFVKVEDGCDRFCTYCRIPYVRGKKIRSRKPEEIISEIKNLYAAGYREIVLTGVNLALYGKDFNSSLVLLLEKILPFLSEDVRIRLSSLEPHLIPEGLLELMAGTELICPHLHLSFQSGDDEILKRMGRGYTTSWLKSLIEKFRKRIPEIGITGDVIVGFPGEKEENFQRTLQFVKDAGFHRLHVFRFSPRPETPASRMKGKVRESVKKERSRILRETFLDTSKEFIKKFTGKTLPVLVESKPDLKTGYPTGYTHNYIKVLITSCKESLDKIKGKILPVRIVQAERGYALGEIGKVFSEKV